MSDTRRWWWLSLALGLGAGACAHSSAPKGSVPAPADAPAVATGGWVELTYREAGRKQHLAGELIAVNADSVWVLNQTGGSVMPTSGVESGKLTVYAAQTGGLTGWVVGGTLATLSNGGFLIFTAPMWIIGGSLTVSGEVRAAERKHPPLQWAELAAFARFPPGMPAGMDLTALRHAH
jgi:hypothetical protein